MSPEDTHMAATQTQGQPPRLALPVHQALLPDEPLALLPRYMPVKPRLGSVDGCREGSREADQRGDHPTPAGLSTPSRKVGPHLPALRLLPELGVGRLRRWLVFFCRIRKTQGSGRATRMERLFLQLGTPVLPFSYSPGDLGEGFPHGQQVSTAPHPPSLSLLHSSAQSLPGILDDTPSTPREVHGHQGIIGDASLQGIGRGQGGQSQIQAPLGVAHLPAHSPGPTYQGWGTHRRQAQVARLCMQIIFIQLNPILWSRERKRV